MEEPNSVDRIAGRDKVWRIASSKVVSEKKFGEWDARLIKWTDE